MIKCLSQSIETVTVGVGLKALQSDHLFDTVSSSLFRLRSARRHHLSICEVVLSQKQCCCFFSVFKKGSGKELHRENANLSVSANLSENILNMMAVWRVQWRFWSFSRESSKWFYELQFERTKAVIPFLTSKVSYLDWSVATTHWIVKCYISTPLAQRKKPSRIKSQTSSNVRLLI